MSRAPGSGSAIPFVPGYFDQKSTDVSPADWLKDFRAVRKAAAIDRWPSDVARHTAISHFSRKTGSYGLTAEQFGNSESIIKLHRQGRVTSQDTKRFCRLKPRRRH